MTRWPRAARQAERLTAVVVLPTPPFWLATAMIGAGVEVGTTGFNVSEEPGATDKTDCLAGGPGLIPAVLAERD